MSKHPLQKFVVRYGSGEPIFQEGDVGATMFIVQSGRVRLFRDVDGQRRDVGEMEKGDFFGEMSILEGLPRTSSAEAVVDADLIEINNTTFDKMVRGNIEIAIRLMRKLSIRLREAERRLAELHPAGVGVLGRSRPSPTTQARTAEPVTGARLEAEDGSSAHALGGQETLIGRFDPVTEMTPDVDLTDLDLKRSVSRRHARVVRSDDEFALIEEVGALNGTFVNGTKLVAGQPQAIREGDVLSVGMVKLIFRP